MSQFAKVRDLVMGLEADFEKFYEKNNQAAGTRVRKGMQELKVLAQDIRKEVQEMKNSKAAASAKKAPAKKPAAKAPAKGKKK
ncbi:MAG: hypothetical protein OHK0045_12820 [Raineya sp.]